LEINFLLTLTGVGADSRACDRMLASLPQADGTKPHDIPNTLAKMRELQSSKFMKFVGLSVNAHLKIVIEWLQHLEARRSPRFDTVLPEFLALVKTSVSLFCECRSASATSPMVYGKAAHDEMLKALQVKYDKKEVIPYKDISPVVMFFWLADDAQSVFIKTLEQQCSDLDRGAIIVGGASSSSGGAVVKKKINKKNAKKDASQLLANIMAD
jgi:hypothetical protein